MNKIWIVLNFPALATFLWMSCGHSPDGGPRGNPASGETTARTYDPESAYPASERLFDEAEQQLVSGNYRQAADELHQGIIAFRFETGRVHGQAAIRINHSIDTLTRLRSRLRKKQYVAPADLHRAVAHALVLLPDYWRLHRQSRPPVPDDDEGNLFLPVNKVKLREPASLSVSAFILPV